MCGLLDTFSCLHGERSRPWGDIHLLLVEMASHSSSLQTASTLGLQLDGDLHLLAPGGLLLLVLFGVQVERTLRRLLSGLSCPFSLLSSLPRKVLQILQVQICS